MASQSQPNEMSTRQENRSSCPVFGQMRRATGNVQPITIKDMSTGGLQATCFNVPVEGEQISIRFENGRNVRGVIRWSRKGIFGVEFHTAIDVVSVTENVKSHPLRRSTDIG